MAGVPGDTGEYVGSDVDSFRRCFPRNFLAPNDEYPLAPLLPPPPMPAPGPPPPPPDFRELLHDGSGGVSPPEGECDRDVGSMGDREPLWKCEASSLLLPQAPLIPIRGV